MEYIDHYYDRYVKAQSNIARTECPSEGQYAMIIFGCIFNSQNEMLIQQRSYKKKGWPGLWDVSVGGGVQASESSMEAVIREAEEELGIRLLAEECTKVLSLYYEESIHDIFTICKDIPIEDIVIQEEEVEAAKWASEEEIMKMIDKQEFIPVYASFIKLLFQMKNKKGILL